MRVHPYPVLTLKGKLVSSLSCGGQFVIALGQNVKKEIPGLNLATAQAKESASSAGNINSSGMNSNLVKLKKKNSIVIENPSSKILSPKKKRNKSVKQKKRRNSSLSNIYSHHKQGSNVSNSSFQKDSDTCKIQTFALK